MTLLASRGGEGLPPEFWELAPLVYQGDPMWIPEDAQRLQWSFSDQNPWFEKGRAWAFCVPAKARLAVFHHPEARIDGRPALYFGCFETMGDRDALSAVFSEVGRLSQELRIPEVYGPVDFSTFGRYRLRTHAPRGAVTFPGEPYNPRSYPGILRRLGWKRHMLYYTRELSKPQLTATLAMTKPNIGKLEAQGYRFVPLTQDLWLSQLPQLHQIVDEIFGENLGYTPLSWESFRALVGEKFIASSCPKTSVMAFGPQGDIAGFFVAYPHYGPLVVQGSGAEIVRIADLRYDTHFKRLQAMGDVPIIGKTIGVASRHRGKGLMSALGAWYGDRSFPTYSRCIGALARQGNGPLMVLSGWMFKERRYSLYKKRFFVPSSP
ncbi:MAG: hypothetical protein MUC50_07500 [Myxococcota bacterium]|jgi:hypothetical protein|nr:hypothetical protein [Myxococcota bacterium]